MAREEYYSHSKVKTWRRCHKSYDYKYTQGLVRRTSPSALLRGVVYHEMLDNRVMGKDPMEPLVEYEKTYRKLWTEEQGEYPSPDELRSLYHRYCKKWENDGLDYRGRSEIEVVVEYRGLKFKGILDKMPIDREGRVWIMDHKTHKVIPDEETRFSDLQTVLYHWAMECNGEKADGVLWDYIRTKPPAIPEVLKSGGLSQRANIDTDYDTYMQAILDNGLDPSDYGDILSRVKDKVFFKRVFLPHPSKDMVQSVVEDFFATAREIENSTCTARNMSRDCKSCSYYQLCQAEVRGLDGDFIKKQMFTTREEK